MQNITIERAKEIMGEAFIGTDELKSCAPSLEFSIPAVIPKIPYSEYKLNEVKNHYYLVLGLSKFADGKDVTISNMKAIFGKDPDLNEPCFYNQDWYDKEVFIDIPMKEGWYLIRKNVFEDSRAVMPQELMKTISLPTAIQCTYSFFVLWLSKGENLWHHEFVWCSDLDHNGDRIYCGKYHDVEGVNKNGFSIHRYLTLRPCYAAIDNI